ncbi:MAG: sulfite exporter TauE/SafE family protein [Burkholderiales bacterium]|nr:sulfite exporter TauE/SafE family protein [Burkholderiales bacterium]
MTLAAALVVVFAGLAVGATSIGGVLLVPALTVLSGVPVAEAIAASSFSFAFTGAAGIVLQRLRGPHAGEAPPPALYWGALAGAAAGALSLPWLPPLMPRLAVAGLSLSTGILVLLPAGRHEVPGQVLPAPALIGLVVGCGSAWSGTGGPIVLLPILFFLRVPTLVAVAASQALQLPIAVATVAANLASGTLNLGLGLVLGALLLAGWVAGARLGRSLPVARLRKGIAWGLIAVGLWFGWQSLGGVLT